MAGGIDVPDGNGLYRGDLRARRDRRLQWPRRFAEAIRVTYRTRRTRKYRHYRSRTCAPATNARPAARQDAASSHLGAAHCTPDFISLKTISEAFLAMPEWKVHYNSSRTGVRLTSDPNPPGRGPDGGEAGLHPSNIHDNGVCLRQRRLHRGHASHPRAGRAEPGRLRVPGGSRRTRIDGSSVNSQPGDTVQFCAAITEARGRDVLEKEHNDATSTSLDAAFLGKRRVAAVKAGSCHRTSSP